MENRRRKPSISEKLNTLGLVIAIVTPLGGGVASIFWIGSHYQGWADFRQATIDHQNREEVNNAKLAERLDKIDSNATQVVTDIQVIKARLPEKHADSGK